MLKSRKIVLTLFTTICAIIGLAIAVFGLQTIAILLFLTTTGSCSPPKSEDIASQRLRKLFGIPASVHLDKQTIRSHVLQLLPIGTPTSAVPEILTYRGIGAATNSQYFPPAKNRNAIIRVEYEVKRDPESAECPRIVQTSYGIALHFDEKEKLQDIDPKIWLTGP